MNRVIVLACALALAPASLASAQSLVGTSFEVVDSYEPSEEHFTFELRAGGYDPNHLGTSVAAFRGDIGPMLGFEYDVHIVRIPYVGPIGVGVGFGWAEWSGPARAQVGDVSSGGDVGDSTLWTIPISLLAVLRVDALSRYLDVPLILTGKIGPDIGYWQVNNGTYADGVSIGLRWAAQLALELDFFDRRAARRLDDEWGINHSELFFELYGSGMGDWNGRLPIGTDLAWAVGLGITF